MNIQEARRIALEELDRWDLSDEGWTFDFDNAKRRAGLCSYRDKKITLSEPLANLWPEAAVRDTILHEIAHALAGSRAGHGPEWKLMARAVGADPTRCYDSNKLPRIRGDWRGECPNGHETDAHRMPRRVRACGRCSDTFRPELIIRWEHIDGSRHEMDSAWMSEFIQIMSGLQDNLDMSDRIEKVEVAA